MGLTGTLTIRNCRPSGQKNASHLGPHLTAEHHLGGWVTENSATKKQRTRSPRGKMISQLLGIF